MRTTGFYGGRGWLDGQPVPLLPDTPGPQSVKALDIECPRCGARGGEPCPQRSEPHYARRKALEAEKRRRAAGRTD